MTQALAGTDFRPGGILAGKVDGTFAGLLALYTFGTGKAALMPFLVASKCDGRASHERIAARRRHCKAACLRSKVVVYVFGIEFL